MGDFKVFLEGNSEKEVERLLQQVLKGSPFEKKVYSVGGFVRDELLGIKSKDLDIVVELDGGAEMLSGFLYKTFPDATSRPLRLGAGYPIWHLAFKDDIVYQGDTFKTQGAEVDFADTQKETFPDPSTRQRITRFGSLKDDIERRDFTVNMLLRDLTSGEIVDLTGSSKSDLEQGLLRGHPNVSWEEMFEEDPLRMLRLVRFQVKYGFKIPKSMLKVVRAKASRISIISGERIRDELIKIMDLGELQRGLRLMNATGLLAQIMPEISGLSSFNQSPIHHQEGHVLAHTLMVLNHAKKGVIPQLAALLHDVGKSATQTFDDGKIKFLGHHDASAEIAESILRRLKFDSNIIRRVKKIVSLHMRPHFLSGGVSKKSIRKFIREAGDDLEEILGLAEADGLGKIPQDNSVPELRRRIKEVLDSPIPVKKKAVLNGGEIMALLNLKPGPKIGEIQKYLIELEDELAEEDQVLSKEDAAKEIVRVFSHSYDAS